MVGAEPARRAGACAPLGNDLSVREEDHVNGVGIARRVARGSRQAARADLSVQLRLDVAVVDRGAVVGGGRSDRDLLQEGPAPDALVRPARSRRVVFREPVHVGAVQERLEESRHRGRCRAGDLREIVAGPVEHDDDLRVGDHPAAPVDQARAGGGRERRVEDPAAPDVPPQVLSMQKTGFHARVGDLSDERSREEEKGQDHSEEAGANSGFSLRRQEDLLACSCPESRIRHDGAHSIRRPGGDADGSWRDARKGV